MTSQSYIVATMVFVGVLLPVRLRVTKAVSTVAQQQGRNQLVYDGTPWTQLYLAVRVFRIPKGFCI
jgi:hypothetical protein